MGATGSARYVGRAAAVCSMGAALVTSGCFNWRHLGQTEAPFTPKATIPVTCIEDRSGRDAELFQGEAGGRPAIHVDGVRLGFSPTLVEPREVDGAEMWAAQSCVMLGKPMCDNAIYMKRGELHYFLYWGEQYESEAVVPPTLASLVEQMRHRRVVPAVRDLDLDAPSLKTFAELSLARRERQQWKLVQFAVGGTLQAVAPELGVAEGAAKAEGKSMMEQALDVRFEIDESEKPILAQNAKLASTFAAAKLAAGGSDLRVASLCVGPVGAAR